jgi:hypothetical protein
VRPHWVKSKYSNELASKVLICCARLPRGEFKKLSVETQWHIAELRARIRDMGLSDD